ncbi:tryptophan--tRNA ligase [Patescibacteria group bacterium]|nr:tryptophan--tRNA ligase [Patescibacteria group bacterium]
MAKPLLISGIQPTGRLHLGNYLGALKNFVELQNAGDYRCLFFIADLHALTENPDPKDLHENIIGLAKSFLIAGLDPKRSIIFQQSKIQPLQELKWILSTLVPPGELLRMTAFKEKVLQALKPEEREKLTKEGYDQIIENTNYGLVEYPVLMAADILIFNGEFVPVGKDQLQHLEFARMLARKFNTRFGATFAEPKELLTKTSRVMSLTDPEKKMSKSQPEGCLFLDDSPADIKKKIMRAVTDSGSEVKFDPESKAGVANLLSIYEALSGTPIPELEKKYAGKGYGQFKADLADLAVDALAPFRDTKIADAKIKSALKTGDAKAKKLADAKMKVVKTKLGLL